MGQKFLFVLFGCVFAAVAGATFVNRSYIDWPTYESPIIPDIETIDGEFKPTTNYINPDSLNPFLDKSYIE